MMIVIATLTLTIVAPISENIELTNDINIV